MAPASSASPSRPRPAADAAAEALSATLAMVTLSSRPVEDISESAAAIWLVLAPKVRAT